MSRPIKDGDTITIYWVHDTAWHDVEVLSMPADTGDLLYIRTKSGKVHGISTNSSEFCYISKEEET
jgi:hypothetical protein